MGPDFEAAFARIARERPGGLAVIPDTLMFLNRVRIVEAARRERLPAVYPRREFAEAGGLLSYGASLRANFRRTAYYVDRLLRGARAADLPVEMPTRFEVVVDREGPGAHHPAGCPGPRGRGHRVTGEAQG